MKRFNLSETSADLKLKSRISNFFGEAFFIKNANVAPGTIIPVILSNDDQLYLQSMKWGIDIFGNNSRFHNARCETLSSSPAWSSMCHQRCIILCKGFYLWNSTRVYDPIRKIAFRDNQPFYISPQIHTEGPFFYIAGLYKKVRINGRISFSVTAITTSTEHDREYKVYAERMPFLMRRKDLKRWFHPNVYVDEFLNDAIKINTNGFMKIGLWVNCPEDHKDEAIVLQSREIWDNEQKAMKQRLNEEKKTYFDDLDFDDLDFDAIEREAMKKHKAQKENEEKQTEEEQKENYNKKRGFRASVNGEYDNEDLSESDDTQPPHKKRKLHSNIV